VTGRAVGIGLEKTGKMDIRMKKFLMGKLEPRWIRKIISPKMGRLRVSQIRKQIRRQINPLFQ
jgi:hypothetical protein